MTPGVRLNPLLVYLPGSLPFALNGPRAVTPGVPQTIRRGARAKLMGLGPQQRGNNPQRRPSEAKRRLRELERVGGHCQELAQHVAGRAPDRVAMELKKSDLQPLAFVARPSLFSPDLVEQQLI